MHADLKGALAQLNRSYKAFEHRGQKMTKEQVRKVFKERLKMSNGETVLGGIGLGFFARVFGGIVSIGEGDIPMSLSKHAKTRETGIFGAIDIVGNDLRYIENYKYEAQ